MSDTNEPRLREHAPRDWTYVPVPHSPANDQLATLVLAALEYEEAWVQYASTGGDPVRNLSERASAHQKLLYAIRAYRTKGSVNE